MRSVLNESQFTPFGLWVRQYLRDSSRKPVVGGMSITNLDYVLEDFLNKKIMLLEEKQSGGQLHTSQRLTFRVIDYALEQIAAVCGYEYWGFYVLQFPPNCTMPGPGMTLNGKIVSVDDLVAHLNFERKFCDPLKIVYNKVA